MCRNLRIRTRATLGYARVRAPDLRGHWVYKDWCKVGSVLILRLRQNRPPSTARDVHNRFPTPEARQAARCDQGHPRASRDKHPGRRLVGPRRGGSSPEAVASHVEEDGVGLPSCRAVPGAAPQSSAPRPPTVPWTPRNGRASHPGLAHRLPPSPGLPGADG